MKPMDVETKMDLIKRSPTEEIITEKELRELLETNEHPEHYIGFEISGYLHLGTLIVSGTKINDLAEAGVNVKVFLADWHSFLNKKLGGNWENIIKASEYYHEAFKFFCPKAKIILGSKLYEGNDEYWKDLVRLSSHVTLNRVVRTLTIMGRSMKEKLSFAQLIYPPMQAVDVKYLGNDLPHGGTDQRKIHVLCREVYPKLEWKKPIPIHHHLLPGLAPPPKDITNKVERVIAAKMSKSKPWTAIFIHDSEEEIKRKLLKAYCPPRVVEENPVMEIAKYIIFRFNDTFTLYRKSEYGGTKEYHSYKELEEDYIKGSIHPQDLKLNVAREVNKIIEPIRKYFETPSKKKLLEVFEQTKITR